MDILTIGIMIFNLLISLWNAYASGYNSVLLERTKKMPFKDFFNIANSFSLVLAFGGASYSLSFFISLLASYLGYISPEVALLISAYSFLVFGGLITFAGIVITIESIIVAYYKRNFWSIGIAIYNTIASIWNLYNYITSFSYVKEIAGQYGSSEDNRTKAIIIIVIAALIALFLVYSFYKIGKSKAEKEIK